jgi:adenosylcobinamide-phosphate synthase
MNRGALIAAAFACDMLFGDPHALPHPVRGFALLVRWWEPPARRFAREEAPREFAAGGVLTVAVIGVAYASAAVTIAAASAADRRLGACVEIALAWTTLAGRDLLCEADSAIDALQCGELGLARVRLARIVGRDTASLGPSDVARAVIETLAESACDGIVAPLCALAAGGVPLAFAFKAASTLDSMLGHIEPPDTFFGRTAARLDDAACYLPARASVFAICGLAAVTGADPRGAWRTAWAEGSKHRSPNAGRVEAAMAGALGVRLGGRNSYGGVVTEGPLFGAGFRSPAVRDARRARALVLGVGCACALIFALVTSADAR